MCTLGAARFEPITQRRILGQCLLEGVTANACNATAADAAHRGVTAPGGIRQQRLLAEEAPALKASKNDLVKLPVPREDLHSPLENDIQRIRLLAFGDNDFAAACVYNLDLCHDLIKLQRAERIEQMASAQHLVEFSHSISHRVQKRLQLTSFSSSLQRVRLSSTEIPGGQD